MMKKQRIFTVSVVALVALFLVGGIGIAGESSTIIPFEGYRERAAPPVVEQQRIVGCNLKLTEQTAYWDVFTDNELVTGYWENPDTKLNVLIKQYREGEDLYDCDPTDPPDPIPAMPNIVSRVGIVHGPFTLHPEAVADGHWEGVWKLVFQLDGDRFMTATAKGIGDLKGLTLKVSVRMGPPPSVTDFNGFIVYPPGAD
jgi:hypothetical protein